MNEEENKVEVTETAEAAVEATPVTETVAEEVTAEAAPSEGKKELDLSEIFAAVKKNVKWIAIAVVALILICIIGSCVSNSGSAFTLADQENVYYQKDSETLVTLNGEEITVDEGISQMRTSADQSLTVVKDKESTLFVVDGTELVEVATEVVYYIISNYGDSIAYFEDYEEGVGTLHLYNVSKKKDTVIAEEAYVMDFVLSEDGKTVAFIGDCEVTGGFFGFGSTVEGNVYVSKNGKEPEQVAKNAVPIAVTNGGKQVFYVKDGNKLYMNDEKISSDISSTVYFNKDYTEAIFAKEDSIQYFTVKMKEPVKVKKASFSGIYAPETMVSAVGPSGTYSRTTISYGIESFNEALWRLDYNEAYYVYDKGEETEKLSSYLSLYQMSTNGKSMLYQDGGDLILIKDITKSREGERVAHGLYSSNGFVASEDLKEIYYYNTEDDELCYVKKGEGVRIADDAEEYVYSDKYGVIYFIEDDELFYATKTAKSVKDVCGEEVSSVYVLNGEVYFTHEEDEVYSVNKMKNKAKYETIFELEMEDIWNFDFGDLF